MSRLIRSLVLRLILFLLSILYPYSGFADENSPPAYVPDSKKKSAWLLRMNRTYDEWFVQRKDVHTKDPYIWVYTEDFAKDFGMPDRWVDKELKGADALAFRVGSSFPLCGWNGNKEACNVPTNCIVDLYFNRRTNPLPWNEKLRWTDLQLDQTSAWILSSLRPFNRWNSDVSSRKSPFADPETGADLGWWYLHLSKDTAGGGALLQSYDRSIFETYSFVTLRSFCAEYAGLELHDYTSAPGKEKIFRSVSFPKGWRDRIRSLIEAASRADSDFYRKKFEELNSKN